MKIKYHTIIILSLTLFLSGLTHLNAQIVRPIGTNLSGIQDWSSEYVFVDAFKQCREWIPHEYGSSAPWSSGVTVPLGPKGYPLEIPYDNGVNPPQAIRTLMFFGNLENKYPSGYYRLIASGTGQIRLKFAASGTFSCPVDTLIWVDSSIRGIALDIDTSDVSDPIRDIHFIMPGFENTYSTNPYHPDLLNFIADFQVLRFMDWMKTNNSQNTNWSDRNTLNYHTQTLENGVAYEHIIKLCNLTQKDPWICIPHKANDLYIIKLAQLFRDSLDPGLKIYIEYSNEVWNSQFDQNSYANNMGNVLGYPGQPWEQGWQFYAKRSADVMHIFETEFSDNNRLVKVVSSQSANSWLTNYIVEKFKDPIYNSNQVQADAIAIAPYFGGSVANDIGDAGLINSITVSEIIDSMELSLATSYAWMYANKIVADTHNLELITYEGGQHLVANGAYQNDTAFTTKLTAANRHSRMQDLYCDYFNSWYDSTQAGMFCHFSSHGVYGKYGSWGVKEYMDDTLSPKYLGLQNCVFNFNTDTSTADIIELENKNQLLKIYPVPSSSGYINIEHNFHKPTIYLYDITGRAIRFSIVKHGQKGFVLNAYGYKGFAILSLNQKDVFISRKVFFTD
jgi:hypothetical protein